MKQSKPVSVSAVSHIAADDRDRAMATLTLAFIEDPVFRWQYADAVQYLRDFAGFADAFGGCGYSYETAYHIHAHKGVALWLPPDGALDHAAIGASLPAERVAEVGAVFEQLAAFPPDEPHWYLIFLAVDPARQRRGY